MSTANLLRWIGVRMLTPIAFGAVIGLIEGPSAAQAPDAARTAGREVTFTRDVAPILQRSCQVCHRPGSVAPMSLLTYEDARPWARSIRQKVVARTMPPWTIDRTVGIQKFKGDRSLSAGEIAIIAKWVDSGAPRGNPADMPKPLEFSDNSKWTLADALGRQPDRVVPLAEPIVVPATGANAWIDVVSDSGLTEDRWIMAHETKPSLEGFPVVHHATTAMFTESGLRSEEGFATEYALGKTGDIFPEGTGALIKTGTKIQFNMHYAPNGKRTTDQTSLALWFYPKGYEPKRKVVRSRVGWTEDLDIPPGEDNIRTDGYQLLQDNIRMTVFQPHLHNRGKRQCLEAIYPDGRKETLSCVNWDFGWHIAYNYADDVQPLLAKGTMLHVISWHDNTKANKWNPDPDNWVGFGRRSSDDMAFAHISWYTLTDEEFREQVTARRVTTGVRTSNQP